MRAYLSYFKIRFINGLQYRAAAYAGIATQFAWGFMYIMLYRTFYASNPSKAPMQFNQLSSYIWLQQSFLMLFMTWFVDNEIFDQIANGNIAYEMCRPLDLYGIWFSRNCALRLSKAVLRCFPILLIAYFLPQPYKFNPPSSLTSFMLFTVSMFLSFIVVVAYCMFVYISAFYTVSPVGSRMALVMTADFLSGGLVPLPFLPDWLTKYIYYLPFAAMQNVPLRIYSGNISVNNALSPILLQIAWSIILVMAGKFFMGRVMKRVFVQGG